MRWASLKTLSHLRRERRVLRGDLSDKDQIEKKFLPGVFRRDNFTARLRCTAVGDQAAGIGRSCAMDGCHEAMGERCFSRVADGFGPGHRLDEMNKAWHAEGDRTGRIETIRCAVGDTVPAGAALVEIALAEIEDS